MNEFVRLYWKRNRGWPWPEDSWGLTPMYGEDGWCHSCGVPRHEQTGSIILQRRGLTVSGAWVPNWLFDVYCLERALADEVASRFDVELLAVGWPALPPGDAMQLVVRSVGEAWFDPDELRAKAVERHGTAGATCPECGVWRWMPLVFGYLPPSGSCPVSAMPRSPPAGSGSGTAGRRSARSSSAASWPS